MTIDLITRAQLERVSRKRLHYPLQTAEKDYFLTLALWVIDHSRLQKKLVFKEGTAIHHHYLPQLRFSEDLDFTSLDKRITAEEVMETFESYDFFTVKKQFTSAATIKLTKLQYRDFYDMYFLLKGVAPDFNDVVTLLRRKEIRQPICKERILENWRQAQRFKQADVATIFVRESVSDTAILEMILGFDFAPIE